MKPSIAIPLGVFSVLAALGIAILVANGVFKGHLVWGFIALGGSLLMLVIAVVGAFKYQSNPPNAQNAPSVTDSFKQSMTGNTVNAPITQDNNQSQSQSQKIELHQHHYPPPPVHARKPNIEFGEVKEYQVYLNTLSNNFYMGAKEHNFTRAILIQVINVAGSGTREVTVKAAARFEQEGKSTTVTPLTWIGEYFNHVTLAPLDQRYLILGVMQRGGLPSLETGKPEIVWITPRNNRSSSRTPGVDDLQLSFLGGIKGPRSVTVTVELVSCNGDFLRRKRFLWNWTLTGVEVTPLE